MINVIAITTKAQADAIRSKLDEGTLSKEQVEAIKSRVNVTYRPFTKSGKKYVAYDIICPSMDSVRAMSEYDWQPVGIWDMKTGKLLSEFSRELYLEIMPDEIETDGEGSVVNKRRPTEPRDIHLRAGQAPRQFP